MVEMVETAAILNQAGPRSFVILDEIGRGTATFDGLSIAWACLEHLHEVNRCRTLFATQDANGDFRPLFLQASCATYTQLVDGLNQASGGLGSEFESVLNLTPILTTAGVCPTQAAADQADFQKYQAKQQGLSGTVSSTANAVGGAAKALAPFDPKLPVK